MAGRSDTDSPRDPAVPEAVSRARPLAELLNEDLGAFPRDHRLVIGLHGGSGSGKSETAAALVALLAPRGVLVVSGDDYPRRVPEANDRERRRVYRDAGLQALVRAGEYTAERRTLLARLQAEDRDPEETERAASPWLKVYQEAGREALESYLGQPSEVDFYAINQLLDDFHAGRGGLWLRHLGQSDADLFYTPVETDAVSVLLLEWTHAHSPHLVGIDLPILLEGRPDETLEYRRRRNRDHGVDTAFTALVLAIEQNQILSRAAQVPLVVARDGTVRRTR